MFILLNTFWFIRELKYILFWLYLWQLKDYHVGRYLDHFRTYKGRQIFLNFIYILKLVLLVLFLIADPLFTFLFSILFLVYIAETAIFARGIIKKSVLKPKKTLKTIFLTAFSFAVVIVFLVLTAKLKDSLQPTILLAFDIFTPLIISIIVLFFQPIFVAIRNNTLKKAAEKMKQTKLVSGLRVIAITGSYGKSSTKEFLATILAKKFKVLKTRDNQNSEIGVAKCILDELKPSHQIFIAEVGAYDKGKVKEVCAMLKPKIGIVTGINEQHLALFGSFANLLSAEGGGELAEALTKNGTLIVNGDNKYCLDLYKKTNDIPHNRKKIYSISNKVMDSDIWSESITIKKDRIIFLSVNKAGEMMHFEAKVSGGQNVQNLLGAILVAKELGMTFDEISEACKNITPEQAGITLIKGKHGLEIIDSSYSSNPDGVFADLDYFSIFENKKVIVMPCLIELGEKSSQIHEKIGRKIGEVCDLLIVTSKDKFAEFKKGAMASGMTEKNILLCDKAQDIYSAVTLFCTAEDAVLLEGRVPSELIKLLSE